jgi:excisionase family DNA binding protein
MLTKQLIERGMLRPSDVAQFLDCSQSTAYSLIRRGELETVRVGNEYRVPVRGLVDYCDKYRRKGGSR